MPGIFSPSVFNIQVPKGFAMFTPLGATVATHLGNMTKFTYTPAVEIKPHFTEMAGTKLQDFSAILSKGGAIKANAEEHTAFNLSMFFNGTVNYSNPNAVTVNIFDLNAQIQGALRFVGTNDVGPRWDFQLTNVLIAPSGDYEFVADDYTALPLTMTHVVDQNLTFGRTILLPDVASIAPENYLLPFITGTINQGDIPAFAQVGETMTANIGQWVAVSTLAFQWYSNNVLIVGATNQNYVPNAHDVGNPLTVEVIAYNDNGHYAVTSGPTLPVHS